jgi:general secretion pathway protein K
VSCRASSLQPRRRDAHSLMRAPSRRRDPGTVVVVVLWVLVAFSLLALSFSASVRTEIGAAQNTVDQKRSYYLARAGIEYSIYKILESQSAFFQARQQADQGQLGLQAPEILNFVRLDLADGAANVQIIDETGKINLNLAPAHLIYNLLIMVGVDGPDADMITDSIEDWRDRDDFRRPNGAESDYYQSLNPPYLAKNGPFDVPEELLLVRGVTPEIYYGKKGLTDSGQRVEYYGLQNYLTTFSSIARININAAPPAVLAAIPGLDYDIANEIVAMRQQEPLLDIGQVMEKIPGIPTEVANYLSTMRSQVYTVISSGQLNNSEVVSRIRAVIRVQNAGPRLYTVLYWNESNLEM